MVSVKICGITNLEDALAAVGSGADALGFNFYRRSPRYLEARAARFITEQLPAGVLSVGVFVDEEPETVRRVAREAGVRAVQMHGSEPPRHCLALKETLTVIKALRVGESFRPESVREYAADAILLDAYSPRDHGGTGQTFDWSIARRTAALAPKLFLAGGLSPANVAQAVAAVRPFAVDACSRLESAPGRKDARLVAEFIRAARQCETTNGG